LAVDLGVDALGFVFYERSPRYISPADAAAIVQQLPPFVTAVGLFVDARPEFVKRIVDDARLDAVQLHGDESPAECDQVGCRYIKAARMDSAVDLVAFCDCYPNAAGILVDAHDPDAPGGTGKSFDWSLIPKRCAKPLLLAGGLNSDNVARAIQTVHPYAVDVSSGIEKTKGVKDRHKMRSFMNEVRKIESDGGAKNR
jgi:phosphoribosylanthranilate isomerase